MRTVTVNGRTYCFDTNIPETDCSERIRFTEELLEKAGISREFRICLYNVVKMKHTYVENGSLYGRMGQMSDMEYLTSVLIAAYGEFANYGMAYGYAGLLLGEDSPEARYLTDWDYYDLNYLCFLPQFSSEEDVEKAKAVALDFAAAYVAKNGHSAYQSILEKSGKPEEVAAAREALLSHYKYRGVSPVLSPLLFAMGGTTFDYIVCCEYAVFYMGTDCIARRIEDWLNYSETYLHEDYSTVAYVFDCFREEMYLYQSFLNLYPYSNDIKVFFVDGPGKKQNGAGTGYYNHKHEIYVNHLSVFYEEYIHALTRPFLEKDPPVWQSEGIANYLKNKYARFFNEDNNEIYILDNPLISGAPIGEYLKSIDRPFDSFNDWHDYTDWLVYYMDLYDIEKHWSYSSVQSFMAYLCHRFGEKEVFDYLFHHHDLKRLSEDSLEELTRAWKESLEERFKDYKKAGEAGE